MRTGAIEPDIAAAGTMKLLTLHHPGRAAPFEVRGEREAVAVPGAESVQCEDGYVPVEFQGFSHGMVEVVVPLGFADRIAPAGLFEEVVLVASIASERLPDVVDGVPVEPVAAGAAQHEAAAQDPEAEKPVEFRPGPGLVEAKQVLGIPGCYIWQSVDYNRRGEWPVFHVI